MILIFWFVVLFASLVCSPPDIFRNQQLLKEYKSFWGNTKVSTFSFFFDNIISSVNEELMWTPPSPWQRCLNGTPSGVLVWPLFQWSLHPYDNVIICCHSYSPPSSLHSVAVISMTVLLCTSLECYGIFYTLLDWIILTVKGWLL